MSPTPEKPTMLTTKTKPCGNPKCCASTGICETTTHGHGLLSTLGYWQIPCFTCARHFEKEFKEVNWPFPDTEKEPLKDDIETRSCPNCCKPKDFFKDDFRNDICDECWAQGNQPEFPDPFEE